MKTETWIYLFFIFITIILPLIRGNKKKKAAKATATKPPPVQGDIMQTLVQEFKRAQEQIKEETYTDTPDYAVIEDELADYSEVGETVKPFSYDDEYENYDFSNEKPLELAHEEVSFIATPHEDIYSYSEIGKQDKKEDTFVFNPVDAVIYSEILKRPEY